MSITRRKMIKATIASAVVVSQFPLAQFGNAETASAGTPVPFLDPLPTSPNRPMIRWDQLTEWITPDKDFFSVQHYGVANVDVSKWALEISGLVNQPKLFTLDELKSMPRREIVSTIECSGNGSSTTFMGAVANVRWTGTPLAPLLKKCGLQKEAVEVVFFGADEKMEKIKEGEYPQNFARSLSVPDALQDKILLAYEMNGKPLPVVHGFPLRVIVPGWYGVAWVKWLKRIEVQDRRFMGRFMARDYVTIRGEERPDCTIWRETSVTRMNVKSIVAHVVQLANGTMRITGVAWTDGTPLQRVELSIDKGGWLPMKHNLKQDSKYSWTFWTYDWKNPESGEHTLVSRATDAKGVIQPCAEDPQIKLKKTYYEANAQYPRRIRV